MLYKNYLPALLAISVLFISVLACGALKDGKPAAEEQIRQFHSMLDEGKFDEIYANSDQRMKDAASKEEMIKLLKAVHSKLGSVTGSTTATWNIGNYNLTSTIVMVQETTFENGKGTETFTFILSGKEAHLAGYYINSNDFLSL